MFSNNFFSFIILSLIFFPSSNLIINILIYLSLSPYFFYSSFNDIYLRNSSACLLISVSFSYCSLISFSLSFFYFYIILWNSSLSNLAYWLTIHCTCSYNLSIFSPICIFRASNNSSFNFILNSDSFLSFSLAYRSFYSIALLALNTSNSAYLSYAFSCISLNLYTSLSFSSLIRFYSSRYSASFCAFSRLYLTIFSSSSFSSNVRFYFTRIALSLASRISSWSTF